MSRYCFPLLLVFSSPSNQDGDMKLITVVLHSPNLMQKLTCTYNKCEMIYLYFSNILELILTYSLCICNKGIF